MRDYAYGGLFARNALGRLDDLLTPRPAAQRVGHAAFVGGQPVYDVFFRIRHSPGAEVHAEAQRGRVLFPAAVGHGAIQPEGQAAAGLLGLCAAILCVFWTTRLLSLSPARAGAANRETLEKLLRGEDR